MTKPNFTMLWSPEKMLEVSEKLVAYWEDRKKQLEGRISLMAPEIMSDADSRGRYLSLRSSSERDLRSVKENLSDAILQHQEARYAIESNRGSWPVQSSDLSWFYPWLSDSDTV